MTSLTGSASPPASTKAPARPLRRRLLIVALIAAAIIGLVALLLLVAPRHIARFVADRYLTGMQIDVEGVKTIDIDLLKGEFSMGPVTFRGGSADAGSIGLLGVELSLRDLFEKQALLRRVIVRDVDVAVRQDVDGELSINGIPLRQILAEEAKDEPAPPSKSSWGTGVDDLRVRDANITFTNRKGGAARLSVEHLDLRGFRSWEPEQPGTFVLSGGVNGIDVNIQGTARPFAEKITANAEFGIDGIAFSRIEEYTGPLGFDSTEGTLALSGQTALSLFPDGRLEGTADSKLLLANIDATRRGGAETKLDEGSVIIDGRYALGADGGISFNGHGEAKLNQATGKLADGTALSLAAATLSLVDIDLTMPGDDTLAVSMRSQLNVEEPSVVGPADGAADQLTLDIPRLAITRGGDGTTSVQTTGAINDAATEPDVVGRLVAKAPVLRAPLAFRADTLATDLVALSVQANADGKMTLATRATLRAGNAEASAPASPGQTPTSVRFAGLVVPVGPMTLSSEGDRLKLAGPVNAAVDRLELALSSPAEQGSASGPRRVSAETVNLSLPKLSVEMAPGGINVDGSGAVDLGRPEVGLPATAGQPQASLNAKSGRLTLDNVQMAKSGPDIRVEGGLTGELTGIAGDWGAAQASVSERQVDRRGRVEPGRAATPSGDGGQLALDSLRIGLAPMKMGAGGNRLTVAGNLSTALAGLKATVPAGPQQAPWDVALTQLQIAFSGLDGELLPLLTTGVGKLNVVAGGFAAEQAAPPLPRAPANNLTRIAVQNLRLAPATLGVRTLSDRTALTGSATAEVGGIDIRLPRTDQNPAATAEVRSLRANIEELTADRAGNTLGWSTRMDVLADQLTSKAENGRLASIDLRSLSVGDLRADHRRKMAVERVVLDRLQAFVTRDYLFASATAQKSRPKQAVEAVQDAVQEGWKFQLGSLGVTNGAEIKLRDTTTEPNTTATVDMQSLQVLNLNTGDPKQRTQVRVEATINQFTELAIAGWAAPFGGQPDFDLNARLRRLELPTLSPYAAQAIGVNVESGRLSLDLSAAADGGNLKGLVDLTLRDLGFSPLSPADAQRLSASVGVPIETIVGLMQDDQGRIRLSLPISGNLANPAFDPSDAIRQALTGALQAAVLAPFQLAFAPVALIAKAAGAGGDTIGLQPIPFSAGVASLDGTAQDMASGLVRVLQERDKLKIKVCGRATAADLTAALQADRAPASGPGRDAAAERLAPDLWSLAGERTARVRDALITGGNIKARQVGECRILYDPTDTGPPRVDVTL